MREFNRINTKFYEPIQIVGGPPTRAIVQRPPDIDQPGVEFAAPSLTLRARPESLLQAGQVVRTKGGEHYLLAKHNATGDWKTLHMFWCDRQVSWTRPGSTVDPLTGLTKTGTATNLGPIWIMWERVRREFTELALRVAQERHLAATGYDVRIGDVLNGMTVDRVNDALGIKVLELRG